VDLLKRLQQIRPRKQQELQPTRLLVLLAKPLTRLLELLVKPQELLPVPLAKPPKRPLALSVMLLERLPMLLSPQRVATSNSFDD
jgi:hypothetical protein